MPVESAADLAGMFDPADHAEAVTFRLAAGGASITVNAIFDTPVDDIGGVGGIGARSRAIAAMALLSSFGAQRPRRGDFITRGGELLRIEAAELDSTGAIITLTLGTTG